MPPESKPPKREPKPSPTRREPPELYQVVIECAGEKEQRELFDRLTREGRKLRLLVL
jgi:hypothetical protein